MQKKASKHRFNIIDFLITLIILLVIALLAYIFVFSANAPRSSNTTKIRFVLEVRDVRDVENDPNDKLLDNALDNLNQTLVEGTKKYSLGTVVSIDYVPATIASHNPKTGEFMDVPFENHWHVRYTVEADAIRDEKTGRYSVNGYEILVGSLVYMRLPNFMGTSYCTALNIIEGGE